MTLQYMFPSSIRARKAWPLLLSVWVLSACGGGGSGSATDGSSAGGANTAFYTKGTVEGLGSVVVNGVRYDDASARVFDDEGRASLREALKLGMVVEIVANAVHKDASGAMTGQAQEIRYASEIQGPISALGVNEMVVLGQTVRYDATTVFEEGRAATLRLGAVVEVHGQRNPQGVVLASRIDTEDDRDEAYKLVAIVSDHDALARTFKAGSASISYAGLPHVVIENGQLLRVRLVPELQAGGQWRASVIVPLQALSPMANDVGIGAGAVGVEADIEGYITRMEGARRFVVAGVTVDASNARQFPAGLAVGSLVEVEGRLTNGVLLANEVELERRFDGDDGLEVEGRITALNLAASQFEVRGLVIHFGASRFVGGTAQQLALGTEVEVRGALATDGASVNATVVEFD